MSVTYGTDGIIADKSIQAFGPAYSGKGEGGMSTGISFGPNQSGSTTPSNNIPTVDTVDLEPTRIGGGSAAAGSGNSMNLGSVINGVSFVAGSGYTNGTYTIQSNASGGRLLGEAAVEITIAGGALTGVRVIRVGQQFSGAPTFTVANAINVVDGTGPGAGASGTVTATIGTNGRLNAMGTGYVDGSNKGIRRTTANAGVAINAAVTPSTYLNRSPRAMVTGDFCVAVAP